MYLSKKHKLLFVAVPRTSSNSVQRALLHSEIADPSDVVYSLKNPNDTASIARYHMRPSGLVSEGILSADEIAEYTAFGFVRDPMERWVSSIFLARHTGVLDKSEDPLTQICNLVRSGGSPRPFMAKRKPFSQASYAPFSYENFFFIGDKQVVDAYRWEDVESVTNSILGSKLGTPVSGKFPHIQLNRDGVPEAFREPAQNWLPQDCFETMSAYFSDEVAFFNQVDYISA